MSKTKRIELNRKGTKKLTFSPLESNKYYELKPNDNFHSDKMISVNHMFVVNKELIGNIINQKIRRTLEKILKLLAIIYEDVDPEDDTILKAASTQIDKFRKNIEEEYKDHIDEKEYDLLMKKLEILDSELGIHINAVEELKKSKKTKKKTVPKKADKLAKNQVKPLAEEDNETGSNTGTDIPSTEGGMITSIGTLEEAKALEKEKKKNQR